MTVSFPVVLTRLVTVDSLWRLDGVVSVERHGWFALVETPDIETADQVRATLVALLGESSE